MVTFEQEQVNLVRSSKAASGKIYDCFLFAGEEDLLLARLTKLRNFCTYFVIVESTYTFSGKRRELSESLRKRVISEYRNQVRWKIFSENPLNNAWRNEYAHRNAISSELWDLESGDIVMLSDCDEIVDENFFHKLDSLENDHYLVARMANLRYEIHFRMNTPWYGSIAHRVTGRNLDFGELRDIAITWWIERPDIEYIDSGYHLSYFAKPKELARKIKSFSHAELNTFPYNISLFWIMIKKCGIDFVTGECLEYSTKNQIVLSGVNCNKSHTMNFLRKRLSSFLKPLLVNCFSKRVGSIKYERIGK